jgi:hypothetical protein
MKSFLPKIKNIFSNENNFKELRNELKGYKEKAQIYLEILRRLEQILSGSLPLKYHSALKPLVPKNI